MSPTRDRSPTSAAATITTNNIKAGEKACDYIAQKLNGKGEVAIMNGPPVSSVIDRVNGCKQALAKAPDIKIVSDNQNGKGSREGGLEVMIGLANEGMTMVAVTHEMGFARRAADRILFMADGQIVEEATPEQFFTDPQTSRAKDFLSKILGH